MQLNSNAASLPQIEIVAYALGGNGCTRQLHMPSVSGEAPTCVARERLRRKDVTEPACPLRDVTYAMLLVYVV
jgi:hypothetical protein